MSTKRDIHKVWNAVLSEMEVEFSGMNYNVYLSKTAVKETENPNQLEVVCPNPHIQKRVDEMFKPFIAESLKKITKTNYDLKVTSGTPTTSGKETENLKGTIFAPLVQNDQSPQSIKKKARESGLNPSYTFENYVMSTTNRLAYAIAASIAEAPGERHNPFFLYSGVGQGKTHLIQAIGNRIIEKYPDLKVIYITSEQFANEFIITLQKGQIKKNYTADSFRRKFRSADVLIIDDVQFIAGKASTQEELFHTFNALYLKRKQIILASDRPPEELKNVEERITSRFKSGILADIQQPDYETRIAILRARKNRDKEDIPEEVLDFVAENVISNIRELEGAYHQVLTYHKATGEELNIETAKKALRNIVKAHFDKPVNVSTIMKAVCNYYSINQSDIKGKRRTKEIVLPRQISMYLIHELTQTPFVSIGELLGGRDHTTIMHGVKKIRESVQNEPKLKQDVANIKQFIFTL